MSIIEIEALIENAYAQRAQAYKIRAPRFVIQAINAQIRDLRAKWVEVAA